MAESEIIEPLSDDEFSLLASAARGAALIEMSAGRWAGSIAKLRQRGFLDGEDKFNLKITPAGRQAFEASDDDERSNIVSLVDKVRAAQLKQVSGRVSADDILTVKRGKILGFHFSDDGKIMHVEIEL